MKRLLSIILVLAIVLGCMPLAFADETEATRTPTYTYSQYAAKVGQWGPFKNDGSHPESGPVHEKVAGIGGESSALHITGGPAEGGYIFSFNDSFIGTTHGTNKAYDGAIDASEFVVTYKSNCNVRVQFVAEFRIDKYTYSSKTLTLPSTDGEVQTVTIPLSEFETEGENSGWIYAMRGKYITTNFNPVIEFKLYNIKDGHDMTFEQFGFNWYQEDMVSEVVIEDYKKEYFQNYDAFDYTQGRIGIKRGGSSEVSEWMPLNDPRVEITGFKNTNLNNNLKLTAKVLNKKVEFNVAVVEYKPNNITSITVDSPKTEYLVKEDFDYKTGQVTAHFADGSTETVALDDENVTVTGFNSNTPADVQTITVEYGGMIATYTISVTEFTVSGGITVKNPKRLYKVGDTFDWHTGSIVPGNGTVGKMFSKYATITGFDSSAPVEDQVITVTYGGETTTYTIDIIEADIPIRYKVYLDIENTQCWKWGNQMHTLGPVADSNQEGDGYAIVINGDGTHGGGGAIVFAGDCGAGQHIMDDGTVIDGLIGADGMGFDYINTFTKTRASNYAQYAPSFNFRAEYQNGQGTTVSSSGYKLPVTKDNPDDAEDTGYWVDDYIIDFREVYDKTDKTQATAESIDWLYNMKSVYKNGYAPSIQWRFSGKILDGDMLKFDELYYIWYEDEPVEKIEVTGGRKNYKLGQEFDTTGTVKIYYKNGDIREVGVEYINITGFDSSIAGAQTVTYEYAGKTATYDVNVIETTEPEQPEIKIENVYDESFGFIGMSFIELTLPVANGERTITIGGEPMYYSPQRQVYVGLIDASLLENDGFDMDWTFEDINLGEIVITEDKPPIFIYGNIDGDYDYDTIEEAVDSSDLQALKRSLKLGKKLENECLVAADLDGDGLSDSSDLQALKQFLKSGKQFGVLK